MVQGLGHGQALVNVHVADPVALGADDAVGLALRQQLHRLVAHAGGGDAVLGCGAAAPLDVAQNGDAGVQPQLLFDLLAHGHAAGGALSHHDHKVGLAADAGAADLLSHVLFKVVGALGHQHGGGADGHAHIQRQITGAVAHDLHHGAALVGLHGVAELVHTLHGGVGRGVEADGVVGADDVVVDGAGDTHHGNAELGQVLRAAECAVAADGHQAVQTDELAGGVGLLLPLLGAELVTAGGVQNGAAAVDDAADAGVVHLDDVAGDQALIAAADAHALDAPGVGAADHGADAGVHAGGVAAAGQHADTFDCVFHTLFPHFAKGRCP